jgi:hypothetical protein
MHRAFTRLLLCTMLFCSLAGVGVFVSQAALGQSDFTENRLTKLYFVQPLSDGRLQWLAQDLMGGTTADLGVFGQQGWEAFVARWEVAGSVTRTTVRRTELDQFFLGIPEREEEVSLGRWPGRVVVNAGRDSNGNGTADAVLVVERGEKLSWRFLFDPFTLQGSFKRILFGQAGNIPFLFRARGFSDALGVIVRNQIIYRGLKSSRKRKIRLSGYYPAEPPRSVRGRDGRDTLLFSSENAGGLFVTTFKGRKKSEEQFDGTGTLWIGDVSGSGEETYGVLKNSGELALVSGEMFEVLATGVMVGGYFQESYQPGTISATPLPQPTSSPGVSTPAPTSTTATSTFTVPPTYTATATPTFTATSTFTVPTTYTPYPTFTSSPTATITPTATATYPILNTYPDAAIAFSMRLLRTQHLNTSTPYALRVVRTSDSAQQDIGFLPSGAFNASGLTSFCGASACKVVTWYDQSANGRNATQGSDSERPTIWNGSTWTTSTGQPGLTFSGNQFLDFGTTDIDLTSASYAFSSVSDLSAVNSDEPIFGCGTTCSAVVNGDRMLVGTSDTAWDSPYGVLLSTELSTNKSRGWSDEPSDLTHIMIVSGALRVENSLRFMQFNTGSLGNFKCDNIGRARRAGAYSHFNGDIFEGIFWYTTSGAPTATIYSGVDAYYSVSSQ